MSTTFVELIDETNWIDDMTPQEIASKLQSHSTKLTNIDTLLADIKTDLKLIQKDVGWHEKLFWRVATIYAAVFVILFSGLLTWYLPKELKGIRSGTEEAQGNVENLRGQVLALRAPQSPRPVFTELANLDQKTFAKSLPALKEVSEHSIQTVQPTASTVENVIGKLRKTEEYSPDYWPALLQFIQFASTGLSLNAPSPGKPQSSLSGNTGFGDTVRLVNQIVLLDGGDLGNEVTFERCRIMFTENPVHMKGVKFIDCVFEIPVTDAPSPYIKQVGTQLLASNLQSVSMTVL